MRYLGKILFSYIQYPPEKYCSGISNYIYHMSRAIKKFCDEVHILTAGPTNSYYYQEEKVKVIQLRISHWSEWYKKSYDYIRKNLYDYDAIEFAGTSAFEFFIFLIKKYINSIVRLHTNTLISYYFDRKEPNFLKAMYFSPLEEIFAKSVKLITAPSKFIARIEGNAWNIPAKKIKVIPNPISLPIPISTENILFKKYGMFDYILFFGRFQKRKGIETILKALPLLDERVKIIFIGKGSLENKIRGCNEKNNIIILPTFENKSELMKIVKDSKAVLLPSLFESFGYTVLEAMSTGGKVITSWCSGAKEIIEHEKNGFLIKPNDYRGLANFSNILINDEKMSKKIGRNAMRRSKDFEGRKIGKSYAKLIYKTFF